MISVSHLEKSYRKLKVLQDINVSFGPGQVVAVIGPNAAGKTTLIKCLLGMVVPDCGEILFNGINILNTEQYRRDLGYMPQAASYPENIKVGQLFRMMKDIRKAKNDLPVDEDLIAAFHLQSYFRAPAHSLSGGTRQKISAALAFLFDPAVLILDEPTAGLDPESVEILKSKILSEKQKGKLILVSSHIMSEVAEISDRVLGLLEGKVTFYKQVSDILSETKEDRFGRAIVKLIKRHQYVEDR